MTQRKGQAKRWLCPCSLHLSDGSCLPPPRQLHRWAARQLGALSAAMCAAGQWARCTSHLCLRGPVNNKPSCSTNRCSPACRIFRWLQNPQKRQLSRLQFSNRMGACARPVEKLLQLDLVGNELGLELKWQLHQPLPLWGKD